MTVEEKKTEGAAAPPSDHAERIRALARILTDVVTDSRYVAGILYGKPRTGHAEGTVANHIEQLKETLRKLRPLLTDVETLKLMVLIHVHDCMKLYAKRDSPIHDNESHATLARRFLAEFTDDQDLLQMVQLHDENWALWKNYEAKGRVKETRLLNCVTMIMDIDTYLLFTVIDGFTPSKEHERIRWFVDLVRERRPVSPKVYAALDQLGI